MKRILIVILLLCLSIAVIAGCGYNSEPSFMQIPQQAPQQPTVAVDTDTINTIVDNIKKAFRNDDYSKAFNQAGKSDFKSFVKGRAGSEYYTDDGFNIAIDSDGDIQLIFLDVQSGTSASTINGFEHVIMDMQANYDGSPTRVLRYIKSEVTSGKYTGSYEEYWYVIDGWKLVMSDKGNIVNGGYEGAVITYGVKTGTDTVYFTKGYDGVNMSPADREPFAAGDDSPDTSRLTVYP